MTDVVVLCDPQGNPIGTALKATVHTTDTPLHLAFSCYVFNTQGQLLITRRALGKKTWPGVWTNSACGHLAPKESAREAALRWVPHELGVSRIEDLCVGIADFEYKATDSSGVVEWEICPVFMALCQEEINPEKLEVDSFSWVSPAQLFDAVDATPFVFSPWMVKQLSDEQFRTKLRAFASKHHR